MPLKNFFVDFAAINTLQNFTSALRQTVWYVFQRFFFILKKALKRKRNFFVFSIFEIFKKKSKNFLLLKIFLKIFRKVQKINKNTEKKTSYLSKTKFFDIFLKFFSKTIILEVWNVFRFFEILILNFIFNFPFSTFWKQ